MIDEVAMVPSRIVGQRARLAAYGGLFLAFIDNFAILPLISPRAEELGADALGVAIAVAGYSLANLVMNLVGGSLVDRLGRRSVVLVSLIASPLCIALYAVAGTLPLFIAVRLLHGAFGGALLVALFTMLADLAPPGRRGSAIGRAGAIIGLAAVIGPALAGLAARELGTTPVFLALAAVIGAGTVLVGGSLPETLAPRGAGASFSGTWRRLLGDGRVRVACFAIFALEAAVGIVTGFLKDGIQARQVVAGMDPERALRYATGAQGGLFSIFAVVAIVLMLSPLARRVDRRGATGISVAGLGVVAVSTALLGASGSLGLDIGGAILYGVGFGLVFPAATASVGISVEPAERGRAYGLFNAAFHAGLVVGPVAAGFASTSADIGPFAVATVMLVAVAAVLPLAGRGSRGA
ncbi:MAG: MFS transporter, partial [Chloroflexi bacterium]|nr:MFS transporter [Chloroflexota bacterium]